MESIPKPLAFTCQYVDDKSHDISAQNATVIQVAERKQSPCFSKVAPATRESARHNRRANAICNVVMQPQTSVMMQQRDSHAGSVDLLQSMVRKTSYFDSGD